MKENEKSKDEIRKEIESIIDTYDIIEVLSFVGVIYRGAISVGEKQINILREVPGFQFLLGLALKKKPVGDEKASIQTALSIVSLLEQYFKSNLKKQDSIDKQLTDNSIEYMVNFARAHNLMWQINLDRFEFQQVNFLKDVYGKLDEYFMNKSGFTISDAIDFSYKIFENSKTIMKDCFSEASQIHVEDDKKTSELMADIVNSSIRNFWIFEKDKICMAYKINLEKFSKFVDIISCTFGDQNKVYDDPLDQNIIFSKPVIKLENESYFCPAPDLILSNLQHVFDMMLEDEKQNKTEIWHRYEKIKKEFVENSTVDFFSKIFPTDQIWKNLEFNFNGKSGEVDVLMAYDTKLFIIEVKSGHLTESAKRGAEMSLKSNLKSLTEKAFDQGKRVRDFIKEVERPIFFDNNNRTSLEIKVDKEKIQFFIINVTLESLSGFSTNLTKLKSLGLFKNDEFPWSVSVFHLQVISDVIKSPSVLIHYLERRLAIQKDESFFTLDELTLLGLYLSIGTLHELNKNSEHKVTLAVPEWSNSIEDYYINGKELPRHHVNQTIMKLVDFFEKIHPLGFTEITSILLDIPHDIADSITEKMQEAISRARQFDRRTDFTLIEPNLSIGITFMASIGVEGLHEQLENYCFFKKYQNKCEKWIGISKDINDNEWFVTEILFLNQKWEKDSEMDMAVSKFEQIISTANHNQKN